MLRSLVGSEMCIRDSISPGKAKTEIIKNWPQPNTTKNIRAFLGLTSFFRRTIKNFSSISAELNKLVRKDSGYRAGPLPAPAARSFQALKHALISKPCLQPVNFAKRIIITTDASATHYGSCMSQIGSDNIERPCGYHSKILSLKESKQQPSMRERAARIHALRHWRPYFCLLYTSTSPRDS